MKMANWVAKTGKMNTVAIVRVNFSFFWSRKPVCTYSAMANKDAVRAGNPGEPTTPNVLAYESLQKQKSVLDAIDNVLV
jgi:hypothetical protein